MTKQNVVVNFLRFIKLACCASVLFLGMVIVSQKVNADSLQHRWAGDVPIMHGLKVEPQLGFAFDSPNGRIVMIFASTKAPLSEIKTFYDMILPQLGWTGSGGSWLRGEEKLMISMVQTARGPLWRIMLQPF